MNPVKIYQEGMMICLGCFYQKNILENGMLCPGWQKWHGMFCPGGRNGMDCFVQGDKNCMGCFVRGGKSLWDVLSGVSKNGIGCWVILFLITS